MTEDRAVTGDAPLSADELVAFCLAKPGATEDYPWGDGELTAKVGGKIFAFIGLGERCSVGVKCGADADEAAVVRERHPGAITVMAYIGRYGWNTVQLADVPGDEVRELIDASYDDVVARLPKSKRPAAATAHDRQVTAAGERAATT